MLIRLYDYAQNYIKNLDLWDFGIIKICLIAFGIMLGIAVPEKCKKGFIAGAGILFAVTFIYLAWDFMGIKCPFCDKKNSVEDDYEWAE